MTQSMTANISIVAIVIVIVAHSLYVWRRGRWLAFDPLNAFWAGAAVCYVFQPASYGDVYASWHATGVLEETLLWILFSLPFVIFGYESKLGVRLGKKFPSMPHRFVPWRLLGSAIVLVGLGLVGYVYLMSSAGGAAAWLAEGRGATDWGAVSGYVAQLEYVLPFGITLLLFHVSLHRTGRLMTLSAIVLCGAMWLWFVYLGSRSRTITFTVMVMAAYYLPKRRQPSVATLAGLFLALLVLVSFQASYRGHFTNLSFNLDQIDSEEAWANILPTWLGGSAERTTVDTSAFAEFNCAMTVIELVPEHVDYNYGYSHLEILTRPIPRSMWPEKRYPHAEAYTPIMREGRLSTTVIPTADKELLMGPAFTFVGHWYSVGGPIALAIFGMLTGVMLRSIRTIHDRAPGNHGDVILFSSLIMLGFFELSSEPLFFVFNLPFTHGPLVLALLFARKRQMSATHPKMPRPLPRSVMS